VLTEATRRRLGAIRALRWEDLDFTRGVIRWRAEADRRGVEWEVPIPAGVAEELRQFQRKLGAISGFMFPAERTPEQPMRR
jgi:integrase